MIPYSRQNIITSDIYAVKEVLLSDFLTQGTAVPKFEELVAEKVGSKYAVSFNSATSALHLACLALDLKKGDILWTSPISFVSSANCGLFCGAEIDFVDIDLLTYNICVKALKKKLEKANVNNALPKIVVVVHLCGHPSNLKEINKLSKKFGFKIIEDASHAIGSMYLGDYVGSCTYSDVTVFSFHPVKIITTGEGGLAASNNKQLIDKMLLLRTHGITKENNKFKNNSDGPWYYEQQVLGFNFRMTDIQAALGISQLTRLNQFVEARNEIAEYYDHELASLPIFLPWKDPSSYSSFHLYVIRIDPDKCQRTRLQVFKQLRAKGLGVNVHYIPIYKQPYFKELGFSEDYCPKAEQYYNSAISIPIYPKLTKKNLKLIVKLLRETIVG